MVAFFKKYFLWNPLFCWIFPLTSWQTGFLSDWASFTSLWLLSPVEKQLVGANQGFSFFPSTIYSLSEYLEQSVYRSSVSIVEYNFFGYSRPQQKCIQWTYKSRLVGSSWYIGIETKHEKFIRKPAHGFRVHSQRAWCEQKLVRRADIAKVLHWSGLIFLDMSANKYNGRIPGNLINLISLQHLNLVNNNFYVKPFPNISSLQQLEHLNLSKCDLTVEISSLENTRVLNILQDLLIGHIPSAVGSLTGHIPSLSKQSDWWYPHRTAKAFRDHDILIFLTTICLYAFPVISQ